MRMYNGNHVLAGLLLVLASVAAQAGVPYKYHTYDYKQPNGDVLKVRVDGNTYYAEERTTDGSLIVYDAAKKGFCYAEVNAAGDQLVIAHHRQRTCTKRSVAGVGVGTRDVKQTRASFVQAAA